MTAARDALDAAISEAELQAAIIECAGRLGWRVHHQRPARLGNGAWRTAIEGHPGFPDLVLLKPPRLLIWELKRQDARRARTTPDQEEWLRQFMRCGVSIGVIRPSDWSSGYVQRVLEGGW